MYDDDDDDDVVVTLKTGLGFVQGHWNWHHLIDRILFPIRLP